MEEIIGKRFITCKNEEVDAQKIYNCKLICLFFTASWCSPCEIFSKELFDIYTHEANQGEKLLEISAETPNDPTSKIKSIQIFNSNYKTNEGISLKSTFKDINEHYLINKVEATLTSATLFIDELDATISIDNKDLGLNIFSREEISIEQIPDNAKIKYLIIWFN